MPLLIISKENIWYYASLVDQYTVQRLEQLNEPMTHVDVLSFVQHRYLGLPESAGIELNALCFPSAGAAIAAIEAGWRHRLPRQHPISIPGVWRTNTYSLSDTVASIWSGRATPFRDRRPFTNLVTNPALYRQQR
jgi:hypothetical protein